MQNLSHLSATTIADSVEIIDNLSQIECEAIILRYAGKRATELSVIRPLLRNQISILKVNQKTLEKKKRDLLREVARKEKAFNKLEERRIKQEQRAADQLHKAQTHAQVTIVTRLMAYYGQYILPSLVNTTLSQLLVKHRGRSIGNNIFDLPDVFTGYESAASIKMRNMVPYYKPCLEHFNPRQWNGERLSATICEYIERGDELTFQVWAHMVHKSCFVHKVTPEENQRLVEFQKSHLFAGPTESYNQAGIELTLVEDFKPNKNWTVALDMIDDNNFAHSEIIIKMCSSMFNVRKAMELIRSDGDREELAMSVLELLEEIAEYEVFL